MSSLCFKWVPGVKPEDVELGTDLGSTPVLGGIRPRLKDPGGGDRCHGYGLFNIFPQIYLAFFAFSDLIKSLICKEFHYSTIPVCRESIFIARSWDWQQGRRNGSPPVETPWLGGEPWPPRRATSACAPTGIVVYTRIIDRDLQYSHK